MAARDVIDKVTLFLYQNTKATYEDMLFYSLVNK